MITKQRLKELEAAEQKLLALEAAGVEDWQGYSIALEGFHLDDAFNYEKRIFSEELEEAFVTGAKQPAGEGCGFSASDDGRENARQLIDAFILKVGEYLKKKDEL